MTKPPRPSTDELKAIKRGQVLIVNLDPSLGYEQNKTRPAVVVATPESDGGLGPGQESVVVSADLLNRKMATLIIVPISTLHDGREPFHHEVKLEYMEGDTVTTCVAQPIQIRAIDRYKRVEAIKGMLTDETMAKISMSLFMVLGGIPDPSKPRKR